MATHRVVEHIRRLGECRGLSTSVRGTVLAAERGTRWVRDDDRAREIVVWPEPSSVRVRKVREIQPLHVEPFGPVIVFVAADDVAADGLGRDHERARIAVNDDYGRTLRRARDVPPRDRADGASGDD